MASFKPTYKRQETLVNALQLLALRKPLKHLDGRFAGHRMLPTRRNLAHWLQNKSSICNSRVRKNNPDRSIRLHLTVGQQIQINNSAFIPSASGSPKSPFNFMQLTQQINGIMPCLDAGNPIDKPRLAGRGDGCAAIPGALKNNRYSMPGERPKGALQRLERGAELGAFEIRT